MALSARTNVNVGSGATLREVSNMALDAKDRLGARLAAAGPPMVPPSYGGAVASGRAAGGPGRGPSSAATSPGADRRHKRDPTYVTEMIADIADMYLTRERSAPRLAGYLAAQTEINEKMRLILVDWLVDVHLKFKLHDETFFLAVDIIDRYLAASRTTRSNLQLVGITGLLLGAKYEEIWPPEVRECIHISANTYTRDDILKMERAICAALQFRLTVPTPFPFLARLLDVVDADEQTRHLALFYLTHAALDYKCLAFLPSQLANASLYLALLALRREPWPAAAAHYSRCRSASEFRAAAAQLLEFAASVPASKYQAVRRKYATPRFGDVAHLPIPNELPADM